MQRFYGSCSQYYIIVSWKKIKLIHIHLIDINISSEDNSKWNFKYETVDDKVHMHYNVIKKFKCLIVPILFTRVLNSYFIVK